MKKLRITALLLAALTLLPTLAACGSDDPAGNEKVDDTTAAATEAPETEPPYDIPDVYDYEGYEFRMQSCEYAASIFAEEENGEPVNDTVYRRNEKIAEQYNITFTAEDRGAGALQGVVNKATASGDDYADLVYYPMTQLISDAYAIPATFVNLYESTMINLDDPWWDASYRDTVTIGGYCPSVSGDIIIHDESGCSIIIFNKSEFDTYYEDDLYAKALSGAWYFDDLYNYGKGYTNDIDGDSKLTVDDQVGISYQGDALYSYLNGFGYKTLTQQDANSNPQINVTDQLYTMYAKILPLFQNEDYFVQIEGLKGSYNGGFAMFNNGKVLFTVNSPHHIMLQHRNMEDEYGLLPFPKYDEKQDRYYSYVSQWYPTLGVPGTVEDPDRAVNILNAMGYSSSELTDVYVNTIISEKASRDEGSKQSALLALESKFYDIDRMMNITGIFTIFNKMTQNGKDVFASEYAKIEEQAQLKLDELFGAG